MNCCDNPNVVNAVCLNCKARHGSPLPPAQPVGEPEHKVCTDEYCDHKECWDAAKARVRENINSARKVWHQKQKAAREPKPAPQEMCSQCKKTVLVSECCDCGTNLETCKECCRKLTPKPAPAQPVREPEPTIKKGLHGKHCSRYVAAEGRYCDKPATVCQGGKYRCDEHDPYALISVKAEPVDAVEAPQEIAPYYKDFQTGGDPKPAPQAVGEPDEIEHELGFSRFERIQDEVKSGLTIDNEDAKWLLEHAEVEPKPAPQEIPQLPSHRPTTLHEDERERREPKPAPQATPDASFYEWWFPQVGRLSIPGHATNSRLLAHVGWNAAQAYYEQKIAEMVEAKGSQPVIEPQRRATQIAAEIMLLMTDREWLAITEPVDQVKEVAAKIYAWSKGMKIENPN